MFWVLLAIFLACGGLAAVGALSWRLWVKARTLGHELARANERVAEVASALEGAASYHQ